MPKSNPQIHQQFTALDTNQKQGFLHLVSNGLKPDIAFKLVYLAICLTDLEEFNELIADWITEFKQKGCIVIA